MKNKIVQQLRESCPWQDSLLYFESIDSTNTRAKELAFQGAPHGTVLLADHQTGGRGRRGRSFHSPAGSGIYMSVILRPQCPASELMHLTCAAAVALCNAVEHSCGFRPGIKWTNDLVYGQRKLAGILTELGFDTQGNVDWAIVGMGINCTQEASQFPEEIRSTAGSLASVSGKSIDRVTVAAAMMDAFYRMDLAEKGKILAQYRTDCVTLGREVSVVRADGIVHHCTALDINEDGALIVRHADGQLETVSSGEVSIRGMYGYV